VVDFPVVHHRARRALGRLGEPLIDLGAQVLGPRLSPLKLLFLRQGVPLVRMTLLTGSVARGLYSTSNLFGKVTHRPDTSCTL
jgi:hypothetical protein